MTVSRQMSEVEVEMSLHCALQGKDPLVDVIKEVFSVIKLAKIVKKTFATTSVYGYGGFGGAFNGNSTQQKKKWAAGGYYGCFFIGALLWL